MSRDVAEGILPIEILHLYSVNESKIDIIKCELICIYCYLDIQIFGCQIFAINYQSKNKTYVTQFRVSAVVVCLEL